VRDLDSPLATKRGDRKQGEPDERKRDSDGDDASRQAAAKEGATTYLNKPFTPQTLATTVQTLLDGAPSAPQS